MKHFIYTPVMAILLMAEAHAGSVSFVIGDVRVESPGKIEPAGPGTRVGEMDTVVTRKRSLAIIDLGNGGILKIYPETRLRIANVQAGQELDLTRGSVFVKLRKGGAERLSVKYKTIVASVRGTLFYMALRNKFIFTKNLWVCVNEGSVEVRDTAENRSMTVNEGEGVLIKGGTALTPPKVYDWTRSLNWNMDPAGGPLIEKELMERGTLGDEY
jgi:ferric-dicitrate binding protein FerR (iron transport regulator)